jgi:hypothetical protein
MFPSDEILLARGKFSTLNKERRAQLERAQGICTMLVTTAHAALRDCEAKPPVNAGHTETIAKCLDNLKDAREKLITLCLGLAELEPEAWPK